MVNNGSTASDKDANSTTDFSKTALHRRLVCVTDSKPKDEHTVMSALIWAASTADVARYAAFRFKAFLNDQPAGTMYLLMVDARQLTIVSTGNRWSNVTAPVSTIVFSLDENGSVIE